MNGLVDVGETNLYYELNGTGPSLMLVPGASGDGGYMKPLADALANEFTVITYDRRGNSRSPRPDGWSQTSPEEQAGDIAGLVEALDVAPTVLLGNSYGAVIALCAILEHERLVRGAVLHDPALISVLENPEEPRAVLEPVIEEAMGEGGPRAAIEAFWDFVAGESIHPLPDVVIDRMFGNGEVLFGLEFGIFEFWNPDEERMSALATPVCLLAGDESPPFFGEAASWIARRVGADVVPVPGGHVGFIDNTHAFVEVVRPLIRSMT